MIINVTDYSAGNHLPHSDIITTVQVALCVFVKLIPSASKSKVDGVLYVERSDHYVQLDRTRRVMDQHNSRSETSLPFIVFYFLPII